MAEFRTCENCNQNYQNNGKLTCGKCKRNNRKHDKQMLKNMKQAFNQGLDEEVKR